MGFRDTQPKLSIKALRREYTLYTSVPEALGFCADALNALSYETFREASAELYSAAGRDGACRFFTGRVYLGRHDNVVFRYLVSLPLEALLLKLLHPLSRVRMRGLVHSHTYCLCHSGEVFSDPDFLVARLSGAIYLSSPSGAVYKAARGDVSRITDIKKRRAENLSRVTLICNGRYSEAARHEKLRYVKKRSPHTKS